MAEYYLKANTGTRCYRVTYIQEGTNYKVDLVHVAGLGTLPTGDPIRYVDEQVPAEVLIVDQVLGRVSAGTVTDYRTAAKAQIDASW